MMAIPVLKLSDDIRVDRTRRNFSLSILGLTFLGPAMVLSKAAQARNNDMLIDDFSRTDLVSTLGTRWRTVTDQVMGGISRASIARKIVDARPSLYLTGNVRLENSGGFVQASLDLEEDGNVLDASQFTGLRLTVRGNDEAYSVHLRTTDNVRPWQSYRAQIAATKEWATIDLPFASFVPHRLETVLDVSRLRRIGLVAIGRAFRADLTVTDLRFYR
jgi:hypothetical protein